MDLARDHGSQSLHRIIDYELLNINVYRGILSIAIMRIDIEELSGFVYAKRKGGKTYNYWKTEWGSHNGRMKQAHLSLVEGKKALSKDGGLAKARLAKAEDIGIKTAGRED